MSKLPLSVVIITLNEEHNIGRCLQSVDWAADTVVVDSGSQDRTQEIAREYNARVFQEAWRGYGPQKQLAVEKAKYDWVLCLDADEAVSPELAREIQDVMCSSVDRPSVDRHGYRFPRLTFHMGKWIRHGGWYPDEQLRLFDRSACQWTQDSVHEEVKGNNVGQLRGDLLHWSFTDLSDQVETNNRYSSLMAEQLWRRGVRFAWGKLIFKPVSKFFEAYFFKLGLLDGFPGFVIAVGAAYSVFLKFAKLREWEMRAKN